MTAQINLAASRNAAWAPTIDIAYTGGALPLDAATIAMQVRLYPGAPGAALISMTDMAFDDLAAPTPDQPDLRILRLYPAAAQPWLAALPTGLNQPEPGEADRFSWDVVITYGDGAQDIAGAGYFDLEPGVTRV